MSIFSIFQSERRIPAWTYTANGTIWRILFSERGNIIGECRNQDQKLATYFCVQSQTGQVLWENKQFEEAWWIGIDAIQNDVVLFHEFAKPDLPQHKKVRAIDVETGKELWKNDDLTFWFGYREKVYAYKDLFEKRVAYALNVHTGEIEHTYSDTFDELQALRRLAAEEQNITDFLFPEILDFGALDVRATSLVKKETKGERVVGDIEYIQEQECLLLNYHVSSPGSMVEAPILENRFSVFDLERGKKIFAEVMGRNLKARVPDTFFAKPPFAYFIKDQQILTALRLWKS